MFPEDLFFDLAGVDEVNAALELEKSGFPPDEAGSLQAFQYRHSVAPTLFLGAYTGQRTLIGYVNATLANVLTAQSMHSHDEHGTSVCIHAITVVEQYRRKGVARRLLEEYIRRLEDNPDIGDTRVQRVLLICHDNLIPFYEKCGFTLVGKSAVVHGANEWFEMCREIRPLAETSQPGLPDIMAALTNTSKNRPYSRPFLSFSSSQDLVTSSGGNKFDILCPRPGCSCVILKEGVAKLQTRESFELEPDTHTPPAPLQFLPKPPAQIEWWLVTPSPMAFENIAFSRPVPSTSPSPEAPRIKLLACAECDLGPFGWSMVGGTEFWLAASRVGYR